MYVELHARSAFSFLEGASVPEALAEACAEQAIPAIALLDRDGVYGSPRMHMAAQKLGLKAHGGTEAWTEGTCRRRSLPRRLTIWRGCTVPIPAPGGDEGRLPKSLPPDHELQVEGLGSLNFSSNKTENTSSAIAKSQRIKELGTSCKLRNSNSSR
jgi:hypothetical protein